jgi:ATP-binding cassette subfamily B protein
MGNGRAGRDRRKGAPNEAASLPSWIANLPWGIWGAPIALTIAYGVSRALQALLTQVRDGLFAKVAMHAVRRLAQQTFEHMHALPCASISTGRPAG